MGKDEVAVKKRRKLTTTTVVETPKPVTVDVYKVSFLHIFQLNGSHHS